MLLLQTTLKTGWGGGITAHNTTLTVTDVWFDSCVAGESGAGIQTSISNVTVVRTNCTDCSSSVGNLCHCVYYVLVGVCACSMFLQCTNTHQVVLRPHTHTPSKIRGFIHTPLSQLLSQSRHCTAPTCSHAAQSCCPLLGVHRVHRSTAQMQFVSQIS